MVLVGVLAACSNEALDEASDEAGGSAEGELRSRYDGRVISESEVASLVRSAGFPESHVGRMVCTAKYESRFYERASNQNSGGSIDRGLFQVNSVHLGGTNGCPSRSNAESLFNAETNTRCAAAIFRMQGMNAWYGYRAHRRECDRYPAPASGGIAVPRPGTEPTPVGGEPTDTDGQAEPTPTPTPSPTPSPPSAGDGCYSPTVNRRVEEASCVQAASDQSYYQCHEGYWYPANETTGPYGTCVAVYQLP